MYAMGVVGLVPLLAAGSWNEWSNRALREAELRTNLVEEATYVASEFQRQIEGVQSLLLTLSVIPVVRGTGVISCDQLFDLVRPQNPVLAAIGATDRQGNVICASDRQPGELLPPIADRPHFRKAMETRRPALGAYAYGRRTARHVIHVAVPYDDSAGTLAGVVFASVSLDVIARRHDLPQWNASKVITVIDGEGAIIMRQPDYARFVGQRIEDGRWNRLRSFTTPGNYDAVSSVDGVHRIVGYSPLNAEPLGLFVGIGVDKAAAFAPLNAATLRSLLATLVALALAFGTAWLVARNLIGKPWRRTLRAARRMKEGDLTARVAVIGKGEFADLAAAFNSVADQLVAALSRKDMLLRELSHRVMNSLQVIQSVLRLQERSATAEETRAQLRDAASRVQAVAMTYRRLHELNGTDAVDIGELAAAIAEEISRSLLQSKEQITVECQSRFISPQRAMPFALIVNELLTNAAKHGGNAAMIGLSLQVEGDVVALSVTNARSNDSSRARSGAGFGTRMIKAMVQDLAGNVRQVESVDLFETQITFPVADPQEVQDPQEAKRHMMAQPRTT
ncbi:sensor histidine kinase [Phreatobacter cathodiphilus]|nr:histidine kinase dimerization/phosphoacceptor domain -containing protein [Phreatobacter cathodiphilus]